MGTCYLIDQLTASILLILVILFQINESRSAIIPVRDKHKAALNPKSPPISGPDMSVVKVGVGIQVLVTDICQISHTGW